MATWYVDSTATGTGAGTSWVNACTTMAAAITLSAAGDDFNVYNGHSESYGSAQTLTFKGTTSSPNRIFSCDKTNAPAQASDLLAGASFSTTTTFPISVGGSVYIYGFSFTAGQAAVVSAGVSLNIGNTGRLVLDTCALSIPGTSNKYINLGSTSIASDVVLINTTVSFGATGDNIVVKSHLSWIGGGLLAGAAIPTTLFASTTNQMGADLDGVDLHLFTGTVFGASSDRGLFTMVNCRLNASTTIAAAPTAAAGAVSYLINSDSGATNYRLEKYDYPGTQTTDIIHVKTALAGATDGTTPVSHKVVTTANANYQAPFQMIDIVVWVDTTGSSKTATFEVLTDNVILTNSDIHVEANYLSSASYPQATISTSGLNVSGTPNPLATAVNLATSTGGTAGAAATWVLTGFSSGGANAKPQSMSVTFTTQFKGPVRFKIRVAKPSLTVYVDPNPTIV
jgi:hypothetical protein